MKKDFRNGQDAQVYRSKGHNIFNDNLKMVVLIDGDSASASEILAGALYVNGVAQLVGAQSSDKAEPRSTFQHNAFYAKSNLGYFREAAYTNYWMTCPSTRIGRITSYAAYNGKVMPEGKPSICCELYCFGEDNPVQLDKREIADIG